MNFPYRLLPCGLLLVLACKESGSSTATDTETSGATAPITTTTTTGQPTTTTTTTEPTTTDGTTTAATDSTTGPPPAQCSIHANQTDCAGDTGCKWAQIVSYTHGTQGCLGDIHDFCVPKETSGGLTSVWRDIEGSIEVLQFAFNPTDLGPEWNVCDCDGPLACLCTAATLDCPERLDDFCGVIGGESNCNNAVAAGELACGWFSVSDEGPADASCDDAPFEDRCLPGTGLGDDGCSQLDLPYPGVCQGPQDPIFWRDVDGVIEVIKSCGPEPIGWTRCVADDPTQPEECKCRCDL